MRKTLRNHGLGLFFGALFLGSLVGQALSGWHQFNNDQAAEGLGLISLGDYLGSASFAVDVAENWQSEYLQFFLFIFLTVWLVQKGSPESKQLDQVGRESEQEQKIGSYADDDSPKWARAHGWRLTLFSNSLGLVMGLLFLLSWLVQSIAGVAAYNEEQLSNLQDPVSWAQYLSEADFWNRTLQNWQSELLAVASMAVLAIYLRQRGSPESKPVGSAHSATGVEG
jgi:hypothetical protein